MTSDPGPVLVTDTVLLCVVPPSPSRPERRAANVVGVGVSPPVAMPPARPVPVSARSATGVSELVVATWIAALFAPALVGLNVVVMVQDPPAARVVPPQPPAARANWSAFVPVIEIAI